MNSTSPLEFFDVSNNDECIADSALEDSLAYAMWLDAQHNIDDAVRDAMLHADGVYREDTGNRLWGVRFR
jgi:hypothetical protein